MNGAPHKNGSILIHMSLMLDFVYSKLSDSHQHLYLESDSDNSKICERLGLILLCEQQLHIDRTFNKTMLE